MEKNEGVIPCKGAGDIVEKNVRGKKRNGGRRWGGDPERG